MSPVTAPSGMTLPAYLHQNRVWVDGRSGTVFDIAELDARRRGYAARELTRAATGLISLMETWELVNGRLVDALRLVAENPRVWITSTPLYRELSSEARPDTGRSADVVVLPTRSVVFDPPRDLAS